MRSGRRVSPARARAGRSGSIPRCTGPLSLVRPPRWSFHGRRGRAALPRAEWSGWSRGRWSGWFRMRRNPPSLGSPTSLRPTARHPRPVPSPPLAQSTAHAPGPTLRSLTSVIEPIAPTLASALGPVVTTLASVPTPLLGTAPAVAATGRTMARGTGQPRGDHAPRRGHDEAGSRLAHRRSPTRSRFSRPAPRSGVAISRFPSRHEQFRHWRRIVVIRGSCPRGRSGIGSAAAGPTHDRSDPRTERDPAVPLRFEVFASWLAVLFEPQRLRDVARTRQPKPVKNRKENYNAHLLQTRLHDHVGRHGRRTHGLLHRFGAPGSHRRFPRIEREP